MRSFIGLLAVLLVVVGLVNCACTEREKSEDGIEKPDLYEDVKCGLSNSADKIKDGASKVGTSIKEGSIKTYEVVKNGAVKAGDYINDGFSSAVNMTKSGYGFLKGLWGGKSSEEVEIPTLELDVLKDKIVKRR